MEESMQQFCFTLTEQEKHYLKDLVRWSIAQELTGAEADDPPDPPTETLRREFGAFVTLKQDGRLRGCIGHIVADRPLHVTIADMAQAAAFQDPRFPPLTAAEADGLDIEISVLSPITRCPDPKLIEPGRHGLLIRRGQHSGLLLPQVAVEWGWDRRTLLAQTCAKAGLSGKCWRDPDTVIGWFEAEVF